MVNEEEESQLVSEDRRFYSLVFPRQRRLDLKFYQLEEMFPRRVRLSRLDDIFRAWQLAESNMSAANRIHVNMTAVNPNLRILYDFDNFTYSSTVNKIQFNRGPDQFEIKLANDGFIYPYCDAFDRNASYDSSCVYANADGWSQLSDATLTDDFKSVVEFAKSFLGTDDVVGQVLYNEHRERIDLRFRKADPAQDTIRLLVTFKQGFPEHFHDDDHWGHC
jgi:hypothetical protein